MPCFHGCWLLAVKPVEAPWDQSSDLNHAMEAAFNAFEVAVEGGSAPDNTVNVTGSVGIHSERHWGLSYMQSM